LFYEQLVRISPALGTRVGHAAAVTEAEGPEAGLAVLDPIAPDAVSHYQPYWAVRAHLLQRLGKKREAADAYDRAIGLAEDPAVREFLLQKTRLSFPRLSRRNLKPKSDITLYYQQPPKLRIPSAV